ncbi:hypothetical protein SK128_013743, partial [Halocaridina rubra]
HASSLTQVSANCLIKVGAVFEREDSASGPLDFSSEQNDVRKEPRVGEYSDGKGRGVGQSVGEISESDRDFEDFQNEGPLVESSDKGSSEVESLTEQAKKEEPIAIMRSLRNVNKEHGYKVHSASLSKEE